MDAIETKRRSDDGGVDAAVRASRMARVRVRARLEAAAAEAAALEPARERVAGLAGGFVAHGRHLGARAGVGVLGRRLELHDPLFASFGVQVVFRWCSVTRGVV